MPLVHPAIPQGGDGTHSTPLQVDGSGNLLVNIAQGSITSTSGAQYNSSAPTYSNGTTNPLQMDQHGNLLVSGTINATSAATYNSTPPTFSNGTSNALQSDSHGDLLVNLRNSSGTEIGTLSNAVRIDPVGTTTQPVSIQGTPAVTATDNLTQVGGANITLGSKTSANSLPVVIASDQGAVAVSGTFWQSTQPVSGTFWQTTQPVSIAATVNTSATQSGTWTVQPGNIANTTPWLVTQTPATSGGLSSASSNATALTVVKGSAGQLYGYDIGNSGSAAVYVQFFNAATTGAVTLGTTTPLFQTWIPAGGGRNVSFDSGIAFSSGIVVAVTTTRTGSTAPSTAADWNAFYK